MLQEYLQIAIDSTVGYARYLWGDITQPGPHSYFYLLVIASLAVYGLELAFPWRKDQSRIRRGFWVDGFYLFFNFFGFSLVGFNAAGDLVVHAVRGSLRALGLESLELIDVRALPWWGQLLLLFVLRDFIHYWVHRLLHAVPFLWRFHQVHHSVREMGFAAHLRFHPMETVVYHTIEYLPLAAIGFGLDDFFLVHATAVVIGHLNHANVRLPIGPLRYVFNSPQMHLWHHARQLPSKYGNNFGLSLSLWDWLFGTVYWPQDDPDVELGFEDVERYPETVGAQMIEPFRAPRRP
ncbi:MAG: sterol desaturase family protein [Sandaracinaceae bacterium]